MALTSRGSVAFKPEFTANNLRLHQNRLVKSQETDAPYPGGPKNKRTVIQAPPGSGLPDMVVGDITFDDWIERVEALLTPDEMRIAATWYDRVYGEFLNRVDGDEEKASRLMGGWLAAQQNESPSNALNNVLFMWEQLSRGVSPEDVVGKGLPSANRAALPILSGDEVTGGVGQKISDFIDSAEGRDARSIMGSDPGGGQPFTVDIHTARDTGLVDPQFLNRLKSIGYDVPDGLNIDVGGGGIKGTKYENRSLFGQQLTDHLNSINWQGRSDWKPREVQAIGWVGMTDKIGGLSIGGNVEKAFSINTRRISLEAAPGEGSPADIRFGERFRALPEEKQREISFQVTQRAIEKVNQSVGINLGNVVHATGGWEFFTNPSSVQQAIASRDSAIVAAKRLGFLLQQTEVWVNSAKGLTKNPKGLALDFVEVGSVNLRDNDRLADFWKRILDADDSGLIKGYRPFEDIDGNVGIRVLIDRGGKGARAAADAIDAKLDDILTDLDYDVEFDLSEAVIDKVGNNWKENPDGKGYQASGNNKGRGSASAQGGPDLDSDRQKLEDFTDGLISEAERGGGQ